MLHRTKVFALAAVAIFLVLSYWGCNRLSDKPSENQPPEVHFVNIPLDSTTFDYAPVVRWYGSDPDGLVEAFQYVDDSTQAALNAYNADATGEALLQYIANLPPTAWVTTYSSADTIYLRRAEDSVKTQHIFFLRCVDNEGAYSSVKWRTFFRTNNPPNRPKVKWTLDVARTDIPNPPGPPGYQGDYVIPGKLFWGDTLTSTYGGIGFLWQGTDPDSKALNIIPLTFSYLLRNLTTGMPVPYILTDDSNRVIGADTGWSPWSGSAQVTFSAANFYAFYHDLPDTALDGDYQFLLRVRDDGLTEADSMASAEFHGVSAVLPNVQRPASQASDFERGLLVIDWTKASSVYDDFGLRPDQEITDFYNTVIHEGLVLAEQYRNPLVDPDPIPATFDWYLDRSLGASGIIPAEVIRHYKWVWVICDNPPSSSPNPTNILPRLTRLQDYMKVGGQVVISGRGILRILGITSVDHTLLPTLPQDRFLADYFNLSVVTGKSKYQAGTEGNDITDFGSATTTELTLSNLTVDSTVASRISFRGAHFPCLPEVEYFGRAPASNGIDYSQTLYNYGSCSVNDSFNVYRVHCTVDHSTPSVAWLMPLHGHTRILSVGRVYNVTRQVLGEFQRLELEYGTNGLPDPNGWRIVVSTPASAGAWQPTDTLEVDYMYVPIQPSNDQPIGVNYIRLQTVFNYDRFTGGYEIGSFHRFRSGFFTFPVSFMSNDPIPGTDIGKVAEFIAYEAQWFNSARVSRFNLGGGGNGGGGLPHP
jgi:hypothetical protein